MSMRNPLFSVKEKSMESQEIKENIAKTETWKRGFFMLLFLICAKIAGAMMIVIMVYQFLTMLVTGHTNERLSPLSKSLAQYVLQIMQFNTFLTEQRPYPYDNWPQA